MKRTPIFLVAATLFLMVMYFIYDNYRASSPSEAPVKARLALGKNLWNALPIVAHERGFFEEEGLHISLNFQDAGRYCMDALLAGSVEFAAVVEANVAYVGFTGNTNPVVFSQIVTSSCGIIARNDRNIVNETDFTEKTVAYTPATGAEPFLYRFLLKNGIAKDDVNLRKMHPKALQPALVAGEVDAAATWEPFIFNIKKALHNRVIEFRDPDAFTGYMLVAVDRQYMRHNPKTVSSFLGALKRAEKYVREHKEDAQLMLSKYLGMSLEAVQSVWPFFDMTARIDEENLLLAIKYVAENAKTTDPLFADKEIPDYREYLNVAFERDEAK